MSSFGIVRLLPVLVNITIPDFEFDAYALSYVLPICEYQNGQAHSSHIPKQAMFCQFVPIYSY
jgi:hypothetical protein